MSFAMLAGGPVSRNGLPEGIVSSSGGTEHKGDIREATTASPASCASSDSSTEIIESHSAGIKI